MQGLTALGFDFSSSRIVWAVHVSALTAVGRAIRAIGMILAMVRMPMRSALKGSHGPDTGLIEAIEKNLARPVAGLELQPERLSFGVGPCETAGPVRLQVARGDLPPSAVQGIGDEFSILFDDVPVNVCGIGTAILCRSL